MPLPSRVSRALEGYTLVPQEGDARANVRETINKLKRATNASATAHADADDCSPAEMFLLSAKFQLGMAFLICINALTIGLETDFPDLAAWHLIGFLFLMVFALELVARYVILGFTKFFDLKNEEGYFNIFDLFIVVSGFVDTLGMAFYSDSDHLNDGNWGTIFRSIRLLRVLRLLRLMRFIRQLYTLAYGMIIAGVAVFWVAVLMLFVVYICAVATTRSVRTIGEDNIAHEFLEDKFRSIPKSMLTLFELMLNPYLDPFHVAFEVSGGLTAFILIFVLFGSFGLIALLTGVINEAMFEKNQLKLEELQSDRDHVREKLLIISGKLWDKIEGCDMYAEVPLDDVMLLLPFVMQMFRENGLHFADPDELEDVAVAMDVNHDKFVTKAEFLKFLEQMALGVRPLLMFEIRNDVIKELREEFRPIQAMLAELTGKPRPASVPHTSAKEEQGINDSVAQAVVSLRAVCCELREVAGATTGAERFPAQLLGGLRDLQQSFSQLRAELSDRPVATAGVRAPLPCPACGHQACSSFCILNKGTSFAGEGSQQWNPIHWDQICSERSLLVPLHDPPADVPVLSRTDVMRHGSPS